MKKSDGYRGKNMYWRFLFFSIIVMLTLSTCLLSSRDEETYTTRFGWSADGNGYFFVSELDQQIHYVDLNSKKESNIVPKEDSEWLKLDVNWFESDKISFVKASRDLNIKDAELVILDVNSKETEIMFSLPNHFDYCWLEKLDAFMVDTNDSLQIFGLETQSWHNGIYTGQYAKIWDLTCDPMSNKIAFVDSNELFILEVTDNLALKKLYAIEGQFDSPTFSLDGDWLAVITQKGGGSPPRMGVSLISIEDGSQRELIAPRRSNRPTDIAWSPTENVLLTRFVGSGFSLELVDIPDELLK